MHHHMLLARFCLENEIHKKQFPSECYRKDVLGKFYSVQWIPTSMTIMFYGECMCGITEGTVALTGITKGFWEKLQRGAPLTEFQYCTTDGQVCKKHWKPVCISTLVLLLIDGADLGNYKDWRYQTFPIHSSDMRNENETLWPTQSFTS